jgi:peptide/nickel transport system substrate-binding protein
MGGVTRATCLLFLLCSLGACRKPVVAAADAGAPGPSTAWLDGLPEPEAATPQPGGTLVVRAMNEPSGLNLLDDTQRDAWVVRITHRLVTESLLELGPLDGTLQPGLAERWEESADHTRTTLHLREGVTFSDGSPFTAADVVVIFEAIADPKRPSGILRGTFSGLSRARALDAHTVELTWSTPSPFALRELAKLPITPAAQTRGDWAELAAHPLGTGPFVLASWERGQRLTLTRRAGWWGGAVPLERIVFRVVKDHTVATGLLEKGEFDLMTNVQPALWRALEEPRAQNAWAWRDYRRLRGVDNSYSYVGWNEARVFLADVRVRRALARAYPAAQVASAIDLGLELPTTCPFWLSSHGCDPQVQPVVGDLPLARAELADAGWEDHDGDGVLDRDGAPARFSFLLPAASVRLGKLVPLYQEQLKRLGVELTVEKVDPATLGARLKARDFDAVSRVWTEFDTEQDQFETFHSSQVEHGSNFVGYRSPEADALLEALRAEWEPSRRRALERQLHARLYADQPYLFMTVRQSLDLAKRQVHGLTPSVFWYDLRRVWVEH